MAAFFSYWFWPNPGNWHYDDARVVAFLLVCFALIVGSFAISYWRNRLTNPVTRTLSRTWSSVMFWFCIVALLLVVSRVEMIQFLAMRAALALWFVLAVLYVVFQIFQFRRRHYTVMDRVQVVDERDKYLPKRKR